MGLQTLHRNHITHYGQELQKYPSHRASQSFIIFPQLIEPYACSRRFFPHSSFYGRTKLFLWAMGVAVFCMCWFGEKQFTGLIGPANIGYRLSLKQSLLALLASDDLWSRPDSTISEHIIQIKIKPKTISLEMQMLLYSDGSTNWKKRK